MKVVILAGGYGTRLSEETDIRPKPMVEIGNRPILWHIMKLYSAYGLDEFVICCGYKADFIKDWFVNYRAAPVRHHDRHQERHHRGAQARLRAVAGHARRHR